MSMFPNLFASLAYLSFLVVFFFYASYFIVLLYFKRRHHSDGQTFDFIFPTISIVLPVHNEEKVISKKIQNIEEIDYPKEKIEVIFIDGQSTDKTPQIIEAQALECQLPFKLIKQEQRDGYTNAVVKGILSSKGEIIVTMDAASYHYQNAMKHLVKHFIDPKVGAVTGKEIVLGDENKLGPLLERSYRFFYDFVRKAETKMDSTPDSKGEILAVRREICTSLMPRLRLSVNASFDSCVPYQAKLMGYRTIYEELAKYYEYAPISFKERMKVQIRRATVLIGALLIFKNMMLNKKCGIFGRVIMPAHFIMHCVLPSIFLFGVVSLVIATVLNPISVIIIWTAAVVALIANIRSRSFLISFTQSQCGLFVALFRLAKRRESLFIESVESTRSQGHECIGVSKNEKT